jgi:hypothetical protein
MKKTLKGQQQTWLLWRQISSVAISFLLGQLEKFGCSNSTFLEGLRKNTVNDLIQLVVRQIYCE